MTFHYRYKKQIVLIIVTTLFVFLSGIGVYLKLSKSNIKVKKEKLPVLASSNTQMEEVEEKIEGKVFYQVDIKGQVQTPGLYQVPKGSRVMDVILLSGGLTEQGDTTILNLSKKVFDEMVIVVYSKEEVSHFIEVWEQAKVKEEHCIQKEEGAIVNDACYILEEDEKLTEDKIKISINTATLEEFMTLPGIGEAKALNIIRYREENGPFKEIEDIQKVSGIGEALFVKIKDYITV